MIFTFIQSYRTVFFSRITNFFSFMVIYFNRVFFSSVRKFELNINFLSFWYFVPSRRRLPSTADSDLDADTDYELRLTLKDPDGGDAVRTLKARTWAEPVPPKPNEAMI